jgi:hypothetical protein
MDDIKDVKISSLGESNYVKPLRMHYTQVYYQPIILKSGY